MSLLTREWVEQVRHKAEDARFVAARRSLDETAAGYRAFLPPVPERQAGYYHEFFCPEHAVQLIYDPHNPTHHVCPIDGKVYSGEPYDSAYRWSVNDHLSDAALKLAFHALLAAERHPEEAAEDRRRVLEILTTYASRYRTMPPPPRIHPNHPGVVTWSGLDEAVWLIRMAWAHALLGRGVPADVDRQVRADLLMPGAEHMLRIRYKGIHNVTCWNNAAIATLGTALDDGFLIQAALEGPMGTLRQLEDGVFDDGFWWEGSLSYHYYTLAALIWTARSLRAGGRSFAGDDVLDRMFRAPLNIAFPDLTLPALHDCWYHIGLTGEVGHGIPSAAGFYEIAYGWYADPTYAWVLNQNYITKPRDAFEALLDGSPTIPTVGEPRFLSNHCEESGLAVLRSREPRSRQTYLMLKATPDAAAHGHPDQLAIQIFSHGARLTDDLGTPGYGIGLNDTWYRQTASHATVLLGGDSQPHGSASIDRYELGDEYSLVEASMAWDTGVYAGARLRRLIIWRGIYFVDVVAVDSPSTNQIDWVLQCQGELVDGPGETKPVERLVGDGGYQHVAGVRRATLDRQARLGWARGDARLDLHLPPGDGRVYLGTAPANPASEQLSVAVRRHTARRTVFLGVFVPWSATGGSPVRAVRWGAIDEAPYEVSVETAAGREEWTIYEDLRVGWRVRPAVG